MFYLYISYNKLIRSINIDRVSINKQTEVKKNLSETSGINSNFN